MESVVTVTIEPDGADGSIMTIEHALLPPDVVQQHAQGWTVIAGQMATALTTATTHQIRADRA